ncbi:MAG: sulfatase [Planctomycetota bacterium]|nr:sulfatase [Planctomycetota bacterium]
MKRYILSAASSAASLWLVVAVLIANLPANDTRPNVLFIYLDDMNDWISLLDPSSPIKTPNLERLARKGTLFSKAYCMSAACNPSRVATLTGLRPTTSGVYGNKTNWRAALPSRKTIMQQFQTAGYQVFGAGKIFHHHLNNAFHDGASFDAFQPMRKQLYPPEKLNGASKYGSRNTDWGSWPNREEDSIDFGTASYCIDFLKSAQRRRQKGKETGDLVAPFFLACGIFKPHSPFFAPTKYQSNGGPEKIPMPLRNSADWDDLPSGAANLLQSKKWFWDGMQRLDDSRSGAYQEFVEAYAACCRFADAQVGRVLKSLEDTEAAKDTVVILLSDHGFHLGEKDHIEKFALWEKSNHIPLIIVAPGVTTAGSICDQPVDCSVVYPTLLDLCDLPADPSCDGRSLRPLLQSPDKTWKLPALMTYGRGNHALRNGRWRYIRYSDGSEELYDHNTDPNEWRNLANSRRRVHQDAVAELREWLPRAEALEAKNLHPNKAR